MDMKDLIADLTTVKASLLTKETELTTLTASAGVAQATIAELTATVAALTTENTTLKAGDLVKAEASLAAATSFLRDEADRLCVAVGVEKVKSDEGIPALTASISANRTKLSALIPAGGRSEGISAGNGQSNSSVASNRASSFSTT